MFQGKSGVPTVVLEAIADNCCRFWHFNLGSPGALNDLNILDRSPLFDNAVRGESLLLILLSMGMHISMHIGSVTASILAMLVL